MIHLFDIFCYIFLVKPPIFLVKRNLLIATKITAPKITLRAADNCTPKFYIRFFLQCETIIP